MKRMGKYIGIDAPTDSNKVNHRQMKKYKSDGFRNAPVDVLSQLETKTLITLGPDVLEKLPAHRLQLLPPEVLATLSNPTLCGLGPETLARLPSERLQQLPPETLASLPFGIISNLPSTTLGAALPFLDLDTLKLLSRQTCAQVNGMDFIRVSPEFLDRLSNDVLSDLWGRIPRDVFLQLSPSVLKRYHPSYFENIPIEAWKKLSLESMSKLPPQAQGAIPEELRVQTSPVQAGSPKRTPLERTASGSTSISTYQQPAIPALTGTRHSSAGPPPPFSVPNGGLVTARPMPSAFSRPPALHGQDRPPPSSENLSGKSPGRSTSQPPVPRSRPASSNASTSPNGSWSSAALATFASRAAERPVVERKDSHDTRDPPGPQPRHAPPKTPDSEHSSDQTISSKHEDPAAMDRNTQGQDRWIEDFINLKVEHKTIVERLFQYMEKNQPEKTYDRKKDDPVKLLTSYCDKSLDSAHQNFQLVNDTLDKHAQLLRDYENEKRGGQAMQAKFEAEQQRAQGLQDEIDQLNEKIKRLNDEIKQHKGDLIRASAREAEYQTTAASQQNEISRLKNVNEDLDKRLERANKKVEATLLNQQKAIDTQTAALRGTIQGLETQLTSQKNDYGKKIEGHRIYYESEINKKQALLEQQQENHEFDMEQLNIAHQEALTKQAREHQFTLEQLDATHRAQLHTQAQDHQYALDQLEETHENELDKQSQAFALAMQQKEAELRDLQTKYNIDTHDLQTKYNTDTQELQTKYTTDMQALQAQHAEQIKKQRAMYEEQAQRERTDYETQFAQKQAQHEKELRKMAKAHEDNTIHLRERVISLENDLVDNSDDFRPASDDTLKLKYRDLKKWVETITEPFNLGVTNAEALSGGRLDPSGFLKRAGKNQLRFLLRSIVWARIMEGFFSAPFGFGALGSGEGRAMLMGLYMAWRRLFGLDVGGKPAATNNHGPDEVFRLFQTDIQANRFRSTTFQTMMMTVLPKGQRKNAATAADGHNAVQVQTYLDNRQKVHDQILLDLAEVCGGGVSPDIEEKVVDIVRQAGELALEFGSQRAGLGLHMPARGERVKIGHEFVDCVDDDEARGVVEEVDLVVSPKLFRVGDGRNDLKVWKIIFPGEIYPRRS
ncbi:hypothetical protein B0T19DRAFT_429782 [Cercophora scortea]|uniref:Uncharacterized protein n=1 Tax=Cercophora scortea TaxID=314031 RepID=A0AAE0I8P6_9PEZI|nr:hypothetical protein B0T19DRAFT_429782 [Cercophora scortea]